MTTNANRAAHPMVGYSEFNEEGKRRNVEGVSKREYFAAAALQGFCGNCHTEPTYQEHFDNLANASIRMADTLLDALARSEES